VRHTAYPYPLSVITYCAHCERVALQHKNQKLRSAFTGRTDTDGTRRYRHRRGVTCGCVNQSVPCDVIDKDFSRLVKLLSISDKAFDLVQELAIQAQQGMSTDKSPADLEQEKQEAIALCRRRIEAAATLYGDGMIDKGEYRRRVEANEREIAHWEHRTGETERLALQLAMCMEAVDKLNRLWDASSDEDKQGLARSLFEYLVYDLDTRRIVYFRLKRWADEFVIVRGKLYEDEILSGTKEEALNIQGLGKDLPHRGLEPLFLP
jgi:hypothetical protein